MNANRRKRKREALNNNVDSGIKALLPKAGPKALNVSEKKEGLTTAKTTSVDIPIAGFVQGQRGATVDAEKGPLACAANNRTDGATTTSIIQPRRQHPNADVTRGPLARHLVPLAWCFIVWNAMVIFAFVAASPVRCYTQPMLLAGLPQPCS